MDVINASLQLITLSYQYIPCWGHKESQKSNPSIWCSGHNYGDMWCDEWCDSQHP